MEIVLFDIIPARVTSGSYLEFLYKPQHGVEFYMPSTCLFTIKASTLL